MADESFQERTEKATDRRREKAREEGKVAKSVELNSALMLLLGFLTLYLTVPHIARQTMQVMRHTMANAPSIAASGSSFVNVFADYVVRFFLIILPVIVVLLVVAFASNVAQVGFKITPKAMSPRFDKLNPVNGFKRLFALRSLVDMVKNILKVLIIGFIAYKTIQGEFDSFFLLSDMTIDQLAATMGKLSLALGIKIGLVVFVIAILDYSYQRYEFEKSIRMSRQELKEEHKETEGSPRLKARIRQVQREMSRKRMMQAVPTADVVITNPTHLAVALKYDPDEMGAPFVVAKGARLIAQKIKEIAYKHDIPVIEDKPLAQALFKACDVGDIVPANLYRAVAELLAYVYRLKGKVVS